MMGSKDNKPDWKEKLAALRPIIEKQTAPPNPKAVTVKSGAAAETPRKWKAHPKRKNPRQAPIAVAQRHPSGLSSVPKRPGRFAPEIPDRVGPKPKPVAVEKQPSELEGKDALEFVKKRIDLSALAAESPPPESIDQGTRSNLQSTLEAGARVLLDRPAPDEEGNFIGFDFGTSSTKIVIRQQGAGNLAYALPIPDLLQVKERGRTQQHLWRSVVWFQPHQNTFSLAPGEGSVPIEGFKTGLMGSDEQRGSDGHRMTSVPGVTNAQASVAYLAMLIAYVIGHLKTAAPIGFSRDRHFSRFHFGIPVASRDEPRVLGAFHKALSAAFAVAPLASKLGLAEVKDALASASATAEITSETPFIMYEELAGVIAGYKASPDHRTGPHVIVDVGAATLDVATFHIPAGDEKVLVFMSGVDHLGAEALRYARSQEIPDTTFRAACNAHTRNVISTTFLRRDQDFYLLNGIPKPLLFVGGGRLTDVHSELYSHYPRGLEAPLRTPAPGAGLKYDPGTDVERLLLAWGLSQDEIDLPEIKPPSQIEDQVRRHRDYQASYVDKDMC